MSNIKILKRLYKDYTSKFLKKILLAVFFSIIVATVWYILKYFLINIHLLKYLTYIPQQNLLMILFHQALYFFYLENKILFFEFRSLSYCDLN